MSNYLPDPSLSLSFADNDDIDEMQGDFGWLVLCLETHIVLIGEEMKIYAHRLKKIQHVVVKCPNVWESDISAHLHAQHSARLASLQHCGSGNSFLTP